MPMAVMHPPEKSPLKRRVHQPLSKHRLHSGIVKGTQMVQRYDPTTWREGLDDAGYQNLQITGREVIGDLRQDDQIEDTSRKLGRQKGLVKPRTPIIVATTGLIDRRL